MIEAACVVTGDDGLALSETEDPPPADRMDVGVQQWPSGGACSSNMSDGGTGDYCKSDTAGSEDEESKSV